MCTLYKPDPDLYIADWLSHYNHTENRNQEITGMSISINKISTVVDFPICTLIEDIRAAMSEDAELQMPQTHITRGWPQNKDQLQPSFSGYVPLRYDLAKINDGNEGQMNNDTFYIAKADILSVAQQSHGDRKDATPCERVSALDQPECHDTMHGQAMCHMLGTQPPETTLHYEIPCRPWDVVGVHVFTINGKTLLCIIHYHSKFPMVKKVNSSLADKLVQMIKLIFAEFRLSKKCFRCGYKLHD